MDKAERKAEKKLVNFRADSETVTGLEELAERWNCGQTGVIVRAVRECHAAARDGIAGDTRLDEVLEFVRSAPSEMEEAVMRGIARWKLEKPALVPLQGDGPVADNRPKNCRCVHCGERFAGPKWATNCAECKGSGHTNQPAECPVCTEGSAI